MVTLHKADAVVWRVVKTPQEWLVQVDEAELGSWGQLRVYFGSSIVNICRGQGAPFITQVFQHDSICVRGYDLLSGEAHPGCGCPRADGGSIVWVQG